MSDLESQVARRKQELIAEFIEHKKNSSRAGAAAAADKIKVRLSELADIVKDGLVGGWANVHPSAKLRLVAWIAK